MRVLLFTGNGGAGTTACAAAMAARVAGAGRKTLLLSVAAPGALAAAYGVAVGSQPVEITAGLYAADIDPQQELARHSGLIQAWVDALLAAAGPGRLHDGELPLLPGADDLLALFEVANQARSGRWDAVVVDCGPTAQSLRMLALPAATASYFERILPLPRRGRGGPDGEPAAPARRGLFDAVVRLHARLRDVTDLLTDAATSSVHVVLGPHAGAEAEGRRALTALALHGYPEAVLVVNRATEAVGSAFLSTFAPRPVMFVPEFNSQLRGVDTLLELGRRLSVGEDPLTPAAVSSAIQVDRGAASFVLSLALPFVQRDEIDLIRRGDELVVTVQGQRRAIALPSALRRCTVTGARLADDRLSIEFAPDPDLWLRS